MARATAATEALVGAIGIDMGDKTSGHEGGGLVFDLLEEKGGASLDEGREQFLHQQDGVQDVQFRV